MGSGETAPTMVSVHRALVARLPKPVHAVLLDTPYGFQENANDLAARAVDYFRTSVNIEIEVAGLHRTRDTHVAADPVAVERGLRHVADADYVFSGPGSPTYALRQWQDTPIARLVSEKLARGGIVTFASAAALTLGRVTVPVYEVYKVGADVARLDGLDVLSAIGVNAAVIPHWDNAEGGHHDTRFCYLGARRLEIFESMLDDDTFVLGVDEHTALVIDIDEEIATVMGNGSVTVKARDRSQVFSSGETMPLALLRDPWSHVGAAVHTHATNDASSTRTPGASPATTSGLGTDIDTARSSFEAAVASRDAAAAVRACLALESSLHEWSADPTQSDARDTARSSLRAMISALGDAADTGLVDPRESARPWVEAMLEVRRIVRAEKRYDLSDIIRDAFAALGVEVRDTPSGVEWELQPNG
jgi:cyanophycinase-like exopeptidase